MPEDYQTSLGQYLEGYGQAEGMNLGDIVDEDEVQELANKKYYRSSRVRMYYATEYEGNTPIPFCEVRVWVISENPSDWQPRLKKELDVIEDFYLTSISEQATEKVESTDIRGEITEQFESRIDKIGTQSVANVDKANAQNFLDELDVNMRINGREDNVEIDGQEAIISWFRTGLKSTDWTPNRIYRYIAFFDSDGNIKQRTQRGGTQEYVESRENFKNLASKGIIPWDKVPAKEIDLERSWDWYKEKRLQNKDARNTLTMKMLKEETGKEWRTGYDTEFFWNRGKPVIGVYRKAPKYRHKGRFISEEKYKQLKNLKNVDVEEFEGKEFVTYFTPEKWKEYKEVIE